MTALEVREVGPQCLVEDLGRPGLAELGVGRSGAADRAALTLGNRVLGNDEGAAGIEMLGGGLVLRVHRGPLWLCVTGAVCPVQVGGRAIGSHTPAVAADGDEVRVGAPTAGLRSYLAVRGGLDVAPVLGSRSRDVMAELGPAPLVPGDVLQVGIATGPIPGADLVPAGTVAAPGEELCLRAVRGPRADRVADVDRLTTTAWSVSSRSDRVGVRLEGTALLSADGSAAALPSEPARRGAVQVPPGGEPVVFLADHPLTGGYPVVAVVVDADVDRAAQARPGDRVRFTWAPAPR